jgi:DedD protein
VAAPSGWAVQVGSFSERENAASLRKELQRAGFSAFEERVVSGGEPVFRVKVGPEASRSRAKALQAMLRDQEDLDGIVVSHP